MILHSFALLDLKAGCFQAPPFYFPSIGQAVRAVADLLQDLNTTPGRHPEDFVLYLIGTWDDHTGLFTSERTHIADCIRLLPSGPATIPGLLPENNK